MITKCFNICLKIILITAALAYLLLGKTMTPVQAVSGDIGIHDPSMIKSGDCYYAFGTGDPNVNRGNIRILKSCDLTSGWAFLKTVYDTIPTWIPDVIGSTPPNLWAPDINYVNGTYYLYYAGSTFGSNKSVIGLATATDIEGIWTDAGEVIHSMRSDNYNTIDPNLSWDSNGVAWLAFGSFWDGIKMRQIDASTGKLSTVDTKLYSLASRNGGAIEAASMLASDGFYYLFVSFDRCCAGISSTYRIMVGRAKNITGPYVDKDGVDMLSGGGTELLATNGSEIGPGGEDVMNDGSNRLVYHFYGGNDNGKPKLAIRDITITDGWPVLGPKL